jgi:hypothetical protein
MGQFALGIRSLVLKSAVFVILAALLAWTLGGRLWGPARTDFTQQAVEWNGARWHWRMLVGSRDARDLKWNLMRRKGDGDVEVAREVMGAVAGPVAGADGLYYASQETDAEGWTLVRINLDRTLDTWPLPDRLAVEQQLARVVNGQTVQSTQTIMSQRERVLDPEPESADE